MSNKLIIDAGSTKVDWRLLKDDNSVGAEFVTEGLNALLASSQEVEDAFAQASAYLPPDVPIEQIHYYGAGCATPQICQKIKDSLSNVWSPSVCEVNSDLLGAARSLHGREKGIACILGTGSNSCLYDGDKISIQIPSLGFILGDEGGGAALGKRLIGDVFKEQLPQSVREKFLERYNLTLPEILDNLYKQPAPNRYLASFVPFLKDNLWNPYIYSLVLKELIRFVKRNVAMYPGAHALKVSFTGSIAFHFEKLLREAASTLGYSVSEISETPMEGLLRFHSQH